MHECAQGNHAIGLELKHQAISIQSSDQIYIALDQFQPKILST